LTLLHDRLAVTVTLFTLLAGLWGLVAALRRRPVTPAFWGIAGVGEILILAQGLLGVLLYLGGERPARSVHILYGAVTALALPALYAITRGRDDHRVQWLYALLFFLLTALSLRAAATASGG
jgi:hypothetical protein